MFGQGFNYGFLGKPPCFTDTTDIFKDNSGVALYTLDYDASDSGNATGKFGEAAIFNGSSGRIHINNLTIPSTTSISMWVKPSNITTNSTVFTSQTSDYRREYPSLIWFPTSSAYNGFAAIYTQSGGYIGSSSIASANEWHHVVCIKNSDGSGSMYVDNSLIGSVSANTTHPQSSGFTLGCNYEPESGGFKSFFDGQIDQVRIFNKAISPTEVATLYNETKATVDTLQVLGDATCISTYPLDGSSTDLSGNYNGTDTNILYKYDGTSTNVDFGVGGKSLYGARFNGSSSKIESNILQSTNMTFSFWFQTETVGEREYLMGFNTSGSAGYISTRLNANDTIGIAYWNGSTYAAVSSSAITRNTNYNHICITISGTSYSIYYNGNSLGSGTLSGFSASSRTDFVMGFDAPTGSGGYMNGSIDQVRIFNKAISAAEVSKLYGNGAGEIACTYTSTTDNIALPITNTAYYKLDNNSKDSARSTGKFNEGAVLTGTSSQIDFPDIPLSAFDAAAVSVSLWVNMQAVTSGYSSGSYVFRGRGNWIIQVTSSGIVFQKYDTGPGNNGNNDLSYNFSGGTNLNQWYHIVVTDNGTSTSGLNLYVDGVLRDSNSGYANIDDNSWLAGIANYAGRAGGNFKVDQLRIFNKELLASEVAALYNETKNTTNTLQILGDTSCIATYTFDSNSTDLSGNYNGTDTNIAYAYDGTDTNVEYRFGRFGQAAVFNGSNSYIINSSISSQVLNDYTISFWAKWNSVPTGQEGLMGIYQPSTSNGTAMSFANGNFLINTGNSQSQINVSSGFFNLNEWYHIAVTHIDGGDLILYINNNVQGTLSNINNTINSSSVLYLGLSSRTNSGSYNYNQYFGGSIDQVRIYDAALTSDQVTELYNEKPEVDTSNFKTVLYEGAGSTQYISNVGFNLDVDNGGDGGLVWIKRRDSVNNHSLYDTIRGAQQELISNLANADTLDTDALTSFDANGFFLGADGNVNPSSSEFVAWVWKGGGDAVAGTGTGVTNVSVSANTDAGFSIVKYTGGNGVSDTVNHGLANAEMIILKDLTDGTNNWRAWHKDLTSGYWLYLNLTNAQASAASDGGIRNVDANTFGFINGTVAGVEGVNSNASDYIAYVWKSISGYSKIGTYSGSGSSGKVVTVGFKPSLVVIKRVNTGGAGSDHWLAFTSNVLDASGNISMIRWDTNQTEFGSQRITFQDTSFTLTDTDASRNASSGEYIYMAFK